MKQIRICHSRTTAPEILEDFKDDGLDFWVSGFGTGGTLKGVSRVLKEKSPKTKIIVCEPDNSPLLGSGIEQKRNDDGSIAESHPSFRPHLMQGWTPDFIPVLTEDVIKAHHIDQVVAIRGLDALECSKNLARKEGVFVGISGGATLAGALQIAKDAPEGSNILAMLPDTGERYLSTPLFEEISEEMTEEELKISASTPGARFDTPPPPKEKKEEKPPAPVEKQAVKFVEDIVNNKEEPVVLFAMEWCEFCWSARKMFKKCGINYRSVDIDSVEYQEDNQGGKIRSALTAKTGCKTIPQIFIGGEFIGGATDLFDGYKEGKIQERLKKNNVKFADLDRDPYSFLPGWLQPR